MPLIGYDGTLCYHPSDNCPIHEAFWMYEPSLIINGAFLVLFSISFITFAVQGTADAKWLGFSLAMAVGCALEVAGYAGRILAQQDMFAETPFLIQIICLTIGPAFLAAGIYLCLSRIVTTIGPEYSRIKPLSYPKIFIPCDIISLVLQAVGGGMASVAIHNDESTKKGDNVMITGLAFQVATMFVFILIAVDFALRTFRNRKLLPRTAQNGREVRPLVSRPFKAFIIALALSTLCIFIRCVFRVAELCQGWRGELATTQKYFIGLEGTVIVGSVLLLNLCHPGYCFNAAKDARVVQPTRKICFLNRRSIVNQGGVGGAELTQVTTTPSK
ncbi:hypothetical protein COCC4DRAFT_40991 [Bipolaris maydis ATCC 48331]|uniref:RTA1 like protein n=2 Tax=Cochliobolus heterostrophus TaxID=5016 RepID=M2TIW8_COCH5|nr:uncharacterized protein COCC4DRAFT_40991 [Bipolaris maydis ATCC 48331]EMD97355.1 hypothetical protein COCHEDRAFT_1084406 [Bipolaris maydis C5]KAJ5029771.1 RTA1 like protein-domain-containing protein [Bipolaris maydis]ENI04189.1 hypothetical protein COCC4DRAFT_40991 [Bipolaris maydis ATCC 48331]KAJ5055202.1 RTA1 like protein-domain-containing protein [Bipolaris maydis]KAJ5061468.1 RTA1 like protein-domain-containing protein [Bipolaris maydis]